MLEPTGTLAASLSMDEAKRKKMKRKEGENNCMGGNLTKRNECEAASRRNERIYKSMWVEEELARF